MVFLLLASVPGLSGCEKKSPPDLHLQEGYRLLESDPKAAYDALGKAKNQDDPRVLVGRGLALERLRKYEEAEKVLTATVEKADAPLSALALARVRIVLGKLDEARPLVDTTVEKAPGELSALLLSTCLANDEKRARATIAHLKEWEKLAKQGKATPPTAPSEFYLSQKVLHAQLKERKEFEAAAARAAKTKLSAAASAFAMVELAVKAGRRDLAVELLRKLDEEDAVAEHKTKVAKLAHGLGDHLLVGRILETLPGRSPDLLALRAEHKFLTGQPQADVSLRRALDAAKDESTRGRLWSMLAEALLRDGKPKEAKKEAEEMLTKHPSPGAQMLVARTELALAEPQLALSRLGPLLKSPQVPPTARELAALAHVDLGQTDSARQQLRALLKEKPGHLRAAELAADIELRSGNGKEAVRVVEDAREREPKNVGLLLLLAETKRSAAGDDAAIDSLRAALDAVPHDARLWVSLAQALERKGDDAQALATLEKAHQSAPASPMIILSLATRLEKVGEKKRATALYESLIAGAEGDPLALNNLAMLYVGQGTNVERAVELAEKAHKLSPAPGITDTLGWALFKRGKEKDKKRALELLTSVRSKLTSPTSKFHLGAVTLAMGQPEEGKLLLQQALTLPGDFPEADQARQLLDSVK